MVQWTKDCLKSKRDLLQISFLPISTKIAINENLKDVNQYLSSEIKIKDRVSSVVHSRLRKRTKYVPIPNLWNYFPSYSKCKCNCLGVILSALPFCRMELMAFVISIFLFILVAQFKVLATLKLATFLASEYLVLENFSRRFQSYKMEKKPRRKVSLEISCRTTFCLWSLIRLIGKHSS